jgi:hypothetical protein
LSIPAERLSRCEAGAHTLSARFRFETVEIAFALIKGAAEEEAAPAPLPASEESGAFPAPAMIGIFVALAGLGTAIFIKKPWKNRKPRRAQDAQKDS